MKIAIMGAMPEEIEPILSRVGEYSCIKIAGNSYYQCSYGGHELIVAYSKIGKVFSALTATIMCKHFGAECMLFSGVAGAISSELSIGDLVVATELVQHDLDISAFGHPYGFVPEGKQFIETSTNLRALAKRVALAQGVDLRDAVIATGDQFVCDKKRKEWIGETFGADALEMEGASVAVVCDALGVDLLILRAISDSADMDAGFDFDEFLSSSAQVSAEFVLKMVESIE